MNDLDKLRKLIQQADELLTQNVTVNSPEFGTWKTNVERFLVKTFEKDSVEVESFKKTRFGYSKTISDPVTDCRNGIKATQLNLQTYLGEMGNQAIKPCINKSIDNKKVFIVHGHNGEIKEKVARLLLQQNIESIILGEQVNAGKTIIEKFEQNSNVGAAICLFTVDDTGKANKEKDDKPRARQNVVLETGFFMGKLGRERLVIIAENGIELPSDMQGVVYINNNWEFTMLKELKNMGFDIDMNKLS